MQKPKDYLAFTIRLPLDLHARIKAASDKAGQKMIVWFTRAALEKLESEQQSHRSSAEKTHGN